ncbi:MAG: oligosaccharide flippase family protein [Clostridiales bacterium]|nr:oligosaccharide flippase family protein [Clostridiales bacterium]
MSAGKSTLLLTCTGLFSQFLGFLYRIALARLISAEVLGLYQLIMPVYAVLLSLTSVGFTVSLSNLGARYHALGNLRAVAQIRRRCLAGFLISFCPLALFVVLFSDPISVHLLGDARTQLGLLLLLPCLLLTGLENLHKHYFYGIGDVKPPAKAELAEQIIRTAAILGFLMLFLPQNPERTVGLMVAGMIVCEVFSAITLLTLYRRYMGPSERLPGRCVKSSVLRREIWSVFLPVAATSLLGNLMGSANAVLIPRQLVAGGMDVPEALAEFGVLFGMTLPLLLLPSAFLGALSLVLTPRLSRSTALKRTEESRRLICRAMGATALLITPAMAFLVVVGPTIGVFLFREPTVGRYMLPLAAGVLLSSFQSVLAYALNGMDCQRAVAQNSLICDAVQLFFTWLLVKVPGIGLGGFVLGFVVSSALGFLLNWRAVARTTGLRSQIFPWLVAPGLAALLSGLTVNLLFRVLQDAGVMPGLSVAACAAFGLVLYCAALQAQGIHFNSFRL